MSMRALIRLLAILLLATTAGCGGGGGNDGSPTPGGGVPKIGHVFIIVLENENAATTFAPNSPATYLSKTLPSIGQFVPNYYGTGHLSLDNYVAMVSGQAPNAITQSDCMFFTDFIGAPVLVTDGQVLGQGCVYPSVVKTVANQLQDAGLSWKGYMEDMGLDPAREAATCARPALNARDGTQSASAKDQYATRHNPFMYFHSIIDDHANCDAHVVPLTALSADLADGSTPNYVFITPNLCHDGHDTGCANGEPGGLVSADLFLQTWVPQIMASAAYKDDGLIIIMFDEAEAIGASAADSSSCCGEPTGLNTPLPGITGPGGGRVGAVLLSRFITGGTVNETPYNHYSLLRSVEDFFGLEHLGYAGQTGLKPFGAEVFNAGK